MAVKRFGFCVFVIFLIRIEFSAERNLARPRSMDGAHKTRELPFDRQWIYTPEHLNIPHGLLSEVNVNDWPGEECLRYCAFDEAPRICHYNFVLEHYHAMGP